ncbi:MAG: adenylate/guanylate cyclase domain-containing protein, partial [Mariprofundus sp.]
MSDTGSEQEGEIPPVENPAATEKSRRIIMFCDLRDSTEILYHFEQGDYCNPDGSGSPALTYDQFILDVHQTSYECLYLGHENTHTEIYGDGLMAIFPEDNTRYIM